MSMIQVSYTAVLAFFTKYCVTNILLYDIPSFSMHLLQYTMKYIIEGVSKIQVPKSKPISQGEL